MTELNSDTHSAAAADAPWARVLAKVLDLVDAPLAADGVRWAVVGSAATALWGCRVAPNDLDILAADPGSVHQFARLLAAYAADDCGVPPGHPDWRSTHAAPVSEDPLDPGKTCWTFGRWFVDGFKVEVAHIVPPAGSTHDGGSGAGIWEAGPGIWPYVRPVSFRGRSVLVVPAEIQLHTNLDRGLVHRVRELVAVLRSAGWDRELLRRSLTAANAAALASHWPEAAAALAPITDGAAAVARAGAGGAAPST